MTATAPTALVLRADVSHALGAGHVMRLCAIAEAARAAGGRARLVIGGEPDALVASLGAAGHDVARAHSGDEIGSLASHARAIDARAVVLDLRAAGASLAAPLAERGLRVASLDDGDARAHAPIIVNPNFGAEALRGRYAFAPTALLGRSFALLRGAFLAWPRGGPPAHRRLRTRVLISFGGSDPLGATPRALRALVGAPPIDAVVVLGAHARHGAAVDDAIRVARAARHSITRLEHTSDMASLMASCDAAICGAGGTLAELAYLGRPAAAYAVAPDQRALARAQAEAGLVHGGLDLATTSDDDFAADLRAFLGDAERRAVLAARACATIDGRGAARVVEALTTAAPC